MLDAGWDDWVLSDVDPAGPEAVTTPHITGPLLVSRLDSGAAPGAAPLGRTCPRARQYQLPRVYDSPAAGMLSRPHN